MITRLTRDQKGRRRRKKEEKRKEQESAESISGLKNYYNNLKRKWINAKSYNLNEFVFHSFSTFSLAVQCDMSKDPKHKIEEK